MQDQNGCPAELSLASYPANGLAAAARTGGAHVVRPATSGVLSSSQSTIAPPSVSHPNQDQHDEAAAQKSPLALAEKDVRATAVAHQQPGKGA